MARAGVGAEPTDEPLDGGEMDAAVGPGARADEAGPVGMETDYESDDKEADARAEAACAASTPGAPADAPFASSSPIVPFPEGAPLAAPAQEALLQLVGAEENQNLPDSHAFGKPAWVPLARNLLLSCKFHFVVRDEQTYETADGGVARPTPAPAASLYRSVLKNRSRCHGLNPIYFQSWMGGGRDLF